MVKKFVCMSVLSLLLVSCTKTPKEAYFARGEPEGLLDYSSEVVNLKLDSRVAIREMTAVINKEQPTRADLRCSASDAVCRDAKKVLRQFGVKTKYKATNTATVSLFFERILARDCQSRYIDPTNNSQNLNSPTFGCSIAANSVQMVTNKRQFTNPAVMGKTESAKPLEAISQYNQPNKDTSFKDNVNASLTSIVGGAGR